MTSPTEWPATASGVIPQASSSAIRPAPTANRPAWAYMVWSARSSVPSPRTTSATGAPSSSSSRAQARSNAAAKTGEEACRSRPMPARWLPWPANRKPTRTLVLDGATPVITPGAGWPAASAARAAVRSSPLVPVTTARCSNTDRVAASDQATSAGSSSGRAARCAASRDACAARPAAVRADTSHGTGAPLIAGDGGGGAGSASAAAGASARSRWTLVPLMPKAETAARRGRPPGVQGTGSVSRRTSPADQSMCGDGSSACRVRGSTACRRASTILITPAAPAACWGWPILDLTEPSHSGRSCGRSCP